LKRGVWEGQQRREKLKNFKKEPLTEMVAERVEKKGGETG